MTTAAQQAAPVQAFLAGLRTGYGELVDRYSDPETQARFRSRLGVPALAGGPSRSFRRAAERVDRMLPPGREGD